MIVEICVVSRLVNGISYGFIVAWYRSLVEILGPIKDNEFGQTRLRTVVRVLVITSAEPKELLLNEQTIITCIKKGFPINNYLQH